jgi:hypothetical protein
LPEDDSPERILEEYGALTDGIIARLDAIEDVEARDRAIPLLYRSIDGIHALTARAIAIGPLSDDQRHTLDEWLDSRLPQCGVRVNEATKRAVSRRPLLSAKFQTSLYDLTQTVDRFTARLRLAWTPLPLPQSESQRAEHEFTAVRRRVWAAVLSALSRNEYRELEDMFDQAADELEAMLVARLAGGDTDAATERVASPALADAFGSDAAERWEFLRKKYGDEGDSESLTRYRRSIQAWKNAGGSSGL